MPVVLVNRRGPLVVARSYFGCPAAPPACDILHVRHVPNPLPQGKWESRRVQNIHVNLSLPSNERWLQMEKETRYEVRRGETGDRFETEMHLSPVEALIARFVDHYNAFADRKQLSRIDSKQLVALQCQSALALSLVRDSQGPVALHQYLTGEGRARLALSCGTVASDEPRVRQRLARANRMLHWRDMQEFAQKGFTCYDFGGVYLASDRPELNGIARFKMGFGGRLVEEYKCRTFLTVKGRTIAFAAAFFDRLRSRRISKFPRRQVPNECRVRLRIIT